MLQLQVVGGRVAGGREEGKVEFGNWYLNLCYSSSFYKWTGKSFVRSFSRFPHFRTKSPPSLSFSWDLYATRRGEGGEGGKGERGIPRYCTYRVTSVQHKMVKRKYNSFYSSLLLLLPLHTFAPVRRHRLPPPLDWVCQPPSSFSTKGNTSLQHMGWPLSNNIASFFLPQLLLLISTLTAIHPSASSYAWVFEPRGKRGREEGGGGKGSLLFFFFGIHVFAPNHHSLPSLGLGFCAHLSQGKRKERG